MNNCKDALLNIVLPIIAGIFLYAVNDALPGIVKSHAADALWAYAFASALLIIWQRKINYFWMFIAVATAAVFEWLQYRNIVDGTGDLFDLMTYLVFMTAALILNVFFSNQFNYQNPIHE